MIVSLHDVAPPFENEIRAQLDALAAAGIDRVALKVVPNWHDRYPLDSCPSFLDLLRKREAAGDQIVLHGYEHRTLLPYRGHWSRRLRGELFAPGVAEFLSLDESSMERRVRDGAQIIARAGLLRPDTFCAPGWLLGPGAENALRRAGMRRLIGMWSVVDLASARRRRIPAIGYMGVGGMHE
ncbi:MAG TPA: DUF2334 domain-containing protein, partial [Chloroflexota bacterium]|nr:DUF2334 domain-containing protein [Chloroflexota bacterium]